MEDEQEGIVLETGDLENEGIVLPTVEEEVDTETIDTETGTEATTEIDEEKESLKRGVNDERKRRKAAEKKARELEERIKALEEANKTPEKSTLDGLLESGMDEDIAKTIASAIDKRKSDNDNSDLKRELAEVKYEASIAKKSKEAGFEDIAEYSDEIKELVDKGLTLEQSYYAVTYNKPKSHDTKSEIERKVEARMQNNQARKQILGNYNSNSGASANSKAKIKISNEEIAMAAMSGMSPEEYVAFRDMDNAKDYSKYNATKAKK